MKRSKMLVFVYFALACQQIASAVDDDVERFSDPNVVSIDPGPYMNSRGFRRPSLRSIDLPLCPQCGPGQPSAFGSSSSSSSSYSSSSNSGSGSLSNTGSFGNAGFPGLHNVPQSTSRRHESISKSQFVNGQQVYDLKHNKKYEDGRLIHDHRIEKDEDDFGIPRPHTSGAVTGAGVSPSGYGYEGSYSQNWQTGSSGNIGGNGAPGIPRDYSSSFGHEANYQSSGSQSPSTSALGSADSLTSTSAFNAEVERLREELRQRTLSLGQTRPATLPIARGSSIRTETRSQVKYIDGKPVYSLSEDKKYQDGKLIHQNTEEKDAKDFGNVDLIESGSSPLTYPGITAPSASHSTSGSSVFSQEEQTLRNQYPYSQNYGSNIDQRYGTVNRPHSRQTSEESRDYSSTRSSTHPAQSSYDSQIASSTNYGRHSDSYPSRHQESGHVDQRYGTVNRPYSRQTSEESRDYSSTRSSTHPAQSSYDSQIASSTSYGRHSDSYPSRNQESGSEDHRNPYNYIPSTSKYSTEDERQTSRSDFSSVRQPVATGSRTTQVVQETQESSSSGYTPYTYGRQDMDTYSPRATNSQRSYDRTPILINSTSSYHHEREQSGRNYQPIGREYLPRESTPESSSTLDSRENRHSQTSRSNTHPSYSSTRRTEHTRTQESAYRPERVLESSETKEYPSSYGSSQNTRDALQTSQQEYRQPYVPQHSTYDQQRSSHSYDGNDLDRDETGRRLYTQSVDLTGNAVLSGHIPDSSDDRDRIDTFSASNQPTRSHQSYEHDTDRYDISPYDDDDGYGKPGYSRQDTTTPRPRYHISAPSTSGDHRPQERHPYVYQPSIPRTPDLPASPEVDRSSYEHRSHRRTQQSQLQPSHPSLVSTQHYNRTESRQFKHQTSVLPSSSSTVGGSYNEHRREMNQQITPTASQQIQHQSSAWNYDSQYAQEPSPDGSSGTYRRIGVRRKFENGELVHAEKYEQYYESGQLIHENVTDIDINELKDGIYDLGIGAEGEYVLKFDGYGEPSTHTTKHEVKRKKSFINGQQVYDLHHERKFENQQLVHENRTEKKPEDFGVSETYAGTSPSGDSSVRGFDQSRHHVTQSQHLQQQALVGSQDGYPSLSTEQRQIIDKTGVVVKPTYHTRRFEVRRQYEELDGNPIYDLRHERRFEDGVLVHENKTEKGPDDLGTADLESKDALHAILSQKEAASSRSYQHQSGSSSLETSGCITCKLVHSGYESGSASSTGAALPSGSYASGSGSSYGYQQLGNQEAGFGTGNSHTQRREYRTEEHYGNGELLRGEEEDKHYENGQLVDRNFRQYGNDASTGSLTGGGNGHQSTIGSSSSSSTSVSHSSSHNIGSDVNVDMSVVGSDEGVCASSPCLNGGTCIKGLRSYICVCSFGYRDSECQTAYCPTRFCRNGGECNVENGSHVCRCQDGFTGPRCQHKDYDRTPRPQ